MVHRGWIWVGIVTRQRVESGPCDKRSVQAPRMRLKNTVYYRSHGRASVRMVWCLQGEMTSSEDVDVIRYGLREETDMRVCLLNYRKNGTAFLNQFNLSPLRDTSGKLVRVYSTVDYRKMTTHVG